MKWKKWKCGDLMTMGIEFEWPEYRMSGPVIVLRVEAKPSMDANRNMCRMIQVWDPTEEMTYNVIEVRRTPDREGETDRSQDGYFRSIPGADKSPPVSWPPRYVWTDLTTAVRVD